MKQCLGKFTLSRVPYGYNKTWINDEVIYEIEPTTEKVVKDIFLMKSNGTTVYQIGKTLNLNQIPSPNVLNGRKETGYWSIGTISNIL